MTRTGLKPNVGKHVLNEVISLWLTREIREISLNFCRIPLMPLMTLKDLSREWNSMSFPVIRKRYMP